MWTSYGYRILYLYILYLNKARPCVNKITSSWKIYVCVWYESTSRSPCASNHIIFPSFNIIQKYITGILYKTVVIHIFRVDIFNMYIRCIWLNPKYIIPNVYCTTNQCYRYIGPTLINLKLALMWVFVFESNIIIQHYFISNFLVVVNSFTIFSDTILINLHLLPLTH